MKEYPTLTALMSGREPGSVKVRADYWPGTAIWVSPLKESVNQDYWDCFTESGDVRRFPNKGPWLLVSEDAPKLDTLRLEIAARVVAGMHAAPAGTLEPGLWSRRHAYALAEADALIGEARK